MWQCRSIIGARRPSRLPGLPRLALLGAVGLVVPVALAEAGLQGAVAVEHRAEDLDAGLAQAVAAEPRLLARHLAAAQGQHHAVGQQPDDGGVGDRQGGRGVEDDEVEARPHQLEPVAHAVRGEQLRRVRRDRPRGGDPEVRHLGRQEDRLRLRRRGELVDQAEAVGDPEDLVQARLAQVAVDEQHLAAELGEHHGEVRGGRRLPLAGDGRGDGDRLELARRGEQEGGAQRAVRLGDQRPRPLVGHQLDLARRGGRLRRRLLLLAPAAAGRPGARRAAAPPRPRS